jgi:hypothetical protein
MDHALKTIFNFEDHALKTIFNFEETYRKWTIVLRTHLISKGQKREEKSDSNVHQAKRVRREKK